MPSLLSLHLLLLTSSSSPHSLLNALFLSLTVVVKLVLYFWCRGIFARTNNVTIEAVAQDNLNDVMSNAAALFAAALTQAGLDT